jgi:hypothetical protein
MAKNKGRSLPRYGTGTGEFAPDWKGGQLVIENDMAFFDVTQAQVVVGQGYVTIGVSPECARELLKAIPVDGLVTPSNMEPRREYAVTLPRARLVYRRGALVAVFCHKNALREFLDDLAAGR